MESKSKIYPETCEGCKNYEKCKSEWKYEDISLVEYLRGFVDCCVDFERR